MNQNEKAALDALAQNWKTPLVGTAEAARLIRINRKTLNVRLHLRLLPSTRSGLERRERAIIEFTPEQLVYSIFAERFGDFGVNISKPEAIVALHQLMAWTHDNVVATARFPNALAVLHKHVIGEDETSWREGGHDFKSVAPGIIQSLVPNGTFIVEKFKESALLIPVGRMTIGLAEELSSRLNAESRH